jgi:hypothetical protein
MSTTTYADEYAAHVRALADYEQWSGRESVRRLRDRVTTLDDLADRAAELGVVAANEVTARAAVHVASDRGSR